MRVVKQNTMSLEQMVLDSFCKPLPFPPGVSGPIVPFARCRFYQAGSKNELAPVRPVAVFLPGLTLKGKEVIKIM
jgi:hypothetical protein